MTEKKKKTREKESGAAEKMWGPALPLIDAALKQVDEEFAEITIESGFNTLYGRSQLDLKTRELCTITMLTCLGKTEELNLHLTVAMRVGWKVEEIRELMLLCVIPAGWPPVIDALRFLGTWCEKNTIPMPPGKKLRKEYGKTDWYKTGKKKCAKLYGKKIWKQYCRRIAAVDPDLAEYTVSELYGKLLSRDTIDDKTRELCFVAGTGAIRSKSTLKMHISGALNSGATPAEVKEALYHIGSYAGLGASLEAIEVYMDMDLE
ncbi:MAG: carboxymuconolactone decarboxylase family protein [Syntrophales bacterium LBB04]|nr:carboxymuconolactone decarboxylase family protein [Syntrophales bacterium LBB04]